MSSDSGASNGKPLRSPPSEEEQARRHKAIETARKSNQLSGFEPDPEVEALNARYVAGELTRDELTAAIIALAVRRIARYLTADFLRRSSDEGRRMTVSPAGDRSVE